MTRSYLPYLIGVLLVSMSCTAGDYDVIQCDPNVANLSQDVCNSFNSNRTDCTSIYQCDRGTKSCQLGPRDYDRDGDPDASCAGSGGTDCDDFDPKVSGIKKMCNCDPAKLGQPCAIGMGACRNEATYSCKSGVIYCTMPRPASADFSEQPNAATGSYDLNCDGTVEMNCVDSKGTTRGSCPQTSCDGTAYGDKFKKATNQQGLDDACANYCSSFVASGLSDPLSTCTPEKIFLCDLSCGKPEYYCSCVVKDNGALANKTCIEFGTVVTHKVLCR